MLYLFSFLKSLQFFGSIAVPFYLIRIGFTYTQMFSMEMIFSIALFLFEVPTGIIADKYGRKISLCFGSLLFGISFIVIGFTHSIYVFICMQILSALGMSLISGADKALIFEIAKHKQMNDEQKASFASKIDAFGTAGLLIAFPVGSLFVASNIISYTSALGATFVASGICTIISGIVILFVNEPKHERCSTKSALKQGVQGFVFIFKNPTLCKLTLNYSIISALTFLMFWFYQSLLLEHKIPVAWNGFVAAGFNCGSMLLLFISEFIYKKLKIEKTLFLSSFIPGLLYLAIFIFPTSRIIAFVGIFGIIMLRMFRAPLLSTMINSEIQDETRATVLSGASMIERIIISIFYPIAGIMMDYSHSWTYFIVGITTTLLSFFLVVRKNKN